MGLFIKLESEKHAIYFASSSLSQPSKGDYDVQ
jgi:hypothetical protein